MNENIKPTLNSETAVLVPPPLLYEMIRSFTVLAQTLNLSHAVEQLGSTRQTVRRHINQLEIMRGSPLFQVVDRHYLLTDEGRAALPDAKDILARGATWLRGQTGSHDMLPYLRAEVGDWQFHQQQQPIGRIWDDDAVLIREVFRAWTMSSGQIEHPCFAHVRPYLIIYRHSEVGWICVEFGEKSVYVQWFGIDFARSSIGRPIAKMPAGEEFSHLLDQSFYEVEATQMGRLDHVFTHMPVLETASFAPVTYQRLMLSCAFPDGSRAVLSLVLPLTDISTFNLDETLIGKLNKLEAPQFDPKDAMFEKVSCAVK